MKSVTDCDLLDDATGGMEIFVVPDSERAAPGTSVSESAEAEQHIQTSEDLDWGDFSIKMMKIPRRVAFQTTDSAERRLRLNASPSMCSKNILFWAKERKEVDLLQQQLLQKEFGNRQKRSRNDMKLKWRS